MRLEWFSNLGLRLGERNLGGLDPKPFGPDSKVVESENLEPPDALNLEHVTSLLLGLLNQAVVGAAEGTLGIEGECTYS